LQGKDGVNVCIAAANQPVISEGPEAVNEQHYRFLQKHCKGNIDPRVAFYRDLLQIIEAWKRDSDHVILGMDENEDVQSGTTKELFWALDMKEAIMS
jgi:hypothetical protein